jgi:hypothetical protein
MPADYNIDARWLIYPGVLLYIQFWIFVPQRGPGPTETKITVFASSGHSCFGLHS